MEYVQRRLCNSQSQRSKYWLLNLKRMETWFLSTKKIGLSDLQIILSLLGIWFIDPNPTAKSGKKNGQNKPKIIQKCPKLDKIGSKMTKSIQKVLELL